MRIMHAYDTPQKELNATIGNILFLDGKSMGHDAVKEIEKALKLARETENLYNHLLLYKLKIKNIEHISSEYWLTERERDFEEENKIIQLLNAERTLYFLRFKVINLYNRGKLNPQIPEIKKKLESIIIEIAPLSPTFHSQTSYLVASAFIAEKEGRYEEGMKFYEQLIALWEKHSVEVREPDTFVASLLSNYLVCAHRCERFDVYPDIIEKIEKIPAANIREEVDLFCKTKLNRLVYELNTLNSKSDDALLSEIDAGLKRNGVLIDSPKQIEFRVNICMLFLRKRNYDRLLDALNKAYEIIGRDEKYNFWIRDLKFYELMARISIKDHDLLGYQLDNTERWLREHGFKNEFTSELFRTIKLISKTNKPAKINGQLTKVNCPDDLLVLRHLALEWLEKN